MATRKQTSLINLSNPIYLEVDGEDEKLHEIDWAMLRSIGDNLQNLISTLTEFSDGDKLLASVDMRLRFTGFFAGSAVSAFKIAGSTNTLFPTDQSIKQVSAEFSAVMQNVETGNFQKIADRYSNPNVKNKVVEAIYNFTNSAGTKSFSIVKPKVKGGFSKVRKIRRMAPDIRAKLKVESPIATLYNVDIAPIEAVGKFLIKKGPKGRTSKKATQLYIDKDASLVLKFDYIETEHRAYVLRSEISFDISQEKKFYFIENKLLDIYATGKTLEEAKDEVNEQFDYTYQRLAKMPDKQLSDHLRSAKAYILLIVESVKHV